MITVLGNADALLQHRGDSRLPHVLLVIDQFPKILGGGERVLLKIADLLPKYGYRVSILTFFVHPDCIDVSSASCPVYVLPLKRTYDWNALMGALEFRRLLRSQHIQIVQTFFESSDLWGGLITKLTSRAKLVWSRRDLGILRTRKHRIAYRLMARLPNMVFSVSEQVRKYCINVDGLKPGQVQTIYNGLNFVDQITTDTYSKAPGAGRVITLGNIRRVKGHDVFIKAASDILRRYPEITFSIAGEVLEEDYFSELKILIRDLDLVEKITFVGGIKDIRQYFSTADVFVLPSRSEGFSNAVIEAMAASLPVVATNVGGNAEAVRDGVTGYIVPVDDCEALSDAVMRLISNPQKAREMGMAGKSLASEKFTTEAMMGCIVSAYKHLLG